MKHSTPLDLGACNDYETPFSLGNDVVSNDYNEKYETPFSLGNDEGDYGAEDDEDKYSTPFEL